MQVESIQIANLSNDPANARKHVSCVDCGKWRSIRKDSKSIRCRKCASVIASKPGQSRQDRKTGSTKNCKQCGLEFYARKSEGSRKFCGKQCADNAKSFRLRSVKKCKKCEINFVHIDKPMSNSPGNFCSLKCRDQSYLGTYNGKPVSKKPKYSGWRSIRNAFMSIEVNQICACCGKEDGRLFVHHIEPHRLSQNNSKENLVTVCGKCHSALEPWSDKIESASPERRRYLVAIMQAAINDYRHIHLGRKIIRENLTGEKAVLNADP